MWREDQTWYATILTAPELEEALAAALETDIHRC